MRPGPPPVPPRWSRSTPSGTCVPHGSLTWPASSASRLDDGDACPVCGSAEHPAKAVLGADHVSAEQVERAEADRASRRGAACTPLPSRCSVLDERAWCAARSRRGTAPRRTRPSGATRHARRSPRRGLPRPTSSGWCRRSTGSTCRPGAGRPSGRPPSRGSRGSGRRWRSRCWTCDAAEAEVVTARGNHPTVAARHAELLERVASSATVLDALAEQDAAQDEARPSGGRAGRGLDEHGFGSADEARAAAVDAAVLAELDRVVTAYATRLDRATAGLAEPAIAALADDLMVDLDAATTAEAAARVEAERTGWRGAGRRGTCGSRRRRGRRGGRVRDRARRRARHRRPGEPARGPDRRWRGRQRTEPVARHLRADAPLRGRRRRRQRAPARHVGRPVRAGPQRREGGRARAEHRPGHARHRPPDRAGPGPADPVRAGRRSTCPSAWRSAWPTS